MDVFDFPLFNIFILRDFAIFEDISDDSDPG